MQLLRNGGLIKDFPFLRHLLEKLNEISLDIASTDQHTLEGTQTKVIMRLAGQLLQEDRRRQEAVQQRNVLNHQLGTIVSHTL